MTLAFPPRLPNRKASLRGYSRKAGFVISASASITK